MIHLRLVYQAVIRAEVKALAETAQTGPENFGVERRDLYRPTT
jgi:hypothetical protein